MKKIIILFILIIIMPLPAFAETSEVSEETTEEIMQSIQENFNISQFLSEVEAYTGDFWEDMDIVEVFQQAIQGKVDNSSFYIKILNILGTEITATLKILISILVVIVIHGILKSMTDNLENNSISQMIYFVQYILIVTLIMANFTDILELVKGVTSNLVGMINVLLPLLLTLVVYTGSIATSTLLEPIILFVINFIGNIIQNILLPIMLVIVVFSIISKISEKVQIQNLSKFLKSSIIWFLGIVLTIFVGIVSLEGTLSSSVDGITAKTAKAAVSSVIPVVGKVLGDVVDSVLGCGVVLKNAVGFIGVVAIIGICVMPIIKIATLSIIYTLASAIVQPIADEKIVKLLEEMGGVFKVLLGIVCALSVMLIVGITMVIKISNSGMMYR